MSRGGDDKKSLTYGRKYDMILCMQGYRSGHNEAVLKTVWGNPRGFESHTLRQNRAVRKGIRRARIEKQPGGLFFRATAPPAGGRIPHPAPEKATCFDKSLFQRNPPFRMGEILLRNMKYACGG